MIRGQGSWPRSDRRGHLTICASITHFSSFDPVFEVMPPLRTIADTAAVRAGLLDGTIDASPPMFAAPARTKNAPSWMPRPV